jgi:hypothetical protein
MNLQVTLVVLLMLSLPVICDWAKPARLGVIRGYGLGSLWAEIQIDRTVYTSHDYCEAIIISLGPLSLRCGCYRGTHESWIRE